MSATTTDTTDKIDLIKKLLDIVGVLIWKAGGTVIITKHDKRVMPTGAYVEVEENRINGTTTFRLVDEKQDGGK